jgi:homoserine kinase type II
MGDYTKLGFEEIQEITNLYIDDKVIDFRPLSLGISNSNYEIKTNDNRYLLKVSNDKNADQVLGEMKILAYLKGNNYKYSILPFKTKKDELVYSYKNVYGVLFPFIDGIPPGPNDNTCYEIGAALASLHNIGGNYDGLRSCEELSYPAKVIAEYIQSPKCPEDFSAAYKNLLGDRAQKYLSQEFAVGIIHGDLYYDNTLFDNNHITAVLDFEQSGIGNLILDLGISISGCCLEKGRISPCLIESYLKGYESVRPLPANEKEFLNEAIILGLLSISLWRIKRFTEGNLNPLMADSYKQLLYRAEIFKQTVS